MPETGRRDGKWNRIELMSFIPGEMDDRGGKRRKGKGGDCLRQLGGDKSP